MKRVILLILDGWGLAEDGETNAISRAHTPNYDKICQEWKFKAINADGKAVGLPENGLPGSEVGHFTIGAGEVIPSDHLLINQTIKKGALLTQEAIKATFDYVRSSGKRLHLMGLCSDSTIHGSIDHMYALLEAAKEEGISDAYIHLFLDGRDVPSRSAIAFLDEAQERCKKIGVGSIASMVGRFYALDRDQHWERTQVAVNLITKGTGEHVSDPIAEIQRQYQDPEMDDYYIPAIKLENTPCLEKGDAMISFNYRSDRVRQITEKLNHAVSVHYLCMTRYKDDWDFPVAFEREAPKNPLGKQISEMGLTQTRIAETEKYAHVTYFFNGEQDAPFQGQKNILIDSVDVRSFAEQPEMKVEEITDTLINELDTTQTEFYVVNFANADLVGHSEKLEATMKAVEAIDVELGRLRDSLKEEDLLVITADHGNAERMAYDNGEPCPSHSKNAVPFIVNKDVDISAVNGLADVAGIILRYFKS